MEMQSEKTAHNKSSLHTFDTKNCNGNDVSPRIYTSTNNNEAEYSERFQKPCYESIEDIIKKYERLKMKHESKLNLNKELDANALFSKKAELMHSFHNFYNNVEPKYFIGSKKKDNHVPDCNTTKPNRILNEGINTKISFVEPKSNHYNTFEQPGLTSRQNLCADKSTYCRPVTSLYNEAFIYKTMERNSKLKRLVRRLAIARQQERDNVYWNNFINDLKNRHRTVYKNSRRTNQHQTEYEQYIIPDIIDDDYSTKFSSEQSKPCKNLLQDFYEKYYVPPQTSYYTGRQPQKSKTQTYIDHYSLPHFTDSYCYPTTSQGNLIVLDRVKQRHEYLNPKHTHISNNSLRYENNYKRRNYYDTDIDENKNSKNSYLPANNKHIPKFFTVSTDVQTESTLRVNNLEFNNQAINKIEDINEIEKAGESFQDTRKNLKTVSLIAIENKLEILIDCINNFIDEIKNNKKSKRKTKATSVTCEINNNGNNKMNQVNVDTVDKAETPWTNASRPGDTTNNSSESTISTSHFYPCAVPRASEINEILNDIDKFRSKDKLFANQSCSYNITFEVPTRDCEKKSLPKPNAGDKAEIIEEISTPEHMPRQQMTIAVNTDPFNFLSLLRISTEALIRFLSHVPNINYHSYLSMLPFPRTMTKVESNFICNICGAAFTKPSALSDHIQNRCLGKTKDCCVCRHVLGLPSHLPRLFKCKFCWQRFTRAYCCELHQRACAERLGLPHDVASCLMLLR